MRTEILMIGSELLLGQIVDTNATAMGIILAEHGINLYQKTTVGDNRARIVAALSAALDRSDVVLCSGGLGPTEDDLTRECVAEAFGVALEYREDLRADLEARFQRIGRTVSGNNLKQLYIPVGGEAIPNPNGTAPGVYMADDRGAVICMPGVPFELKAMMTDFVIPRIQECFGLQGVIRSRVLKVCGVGESTVDAMMGDLIRDQSNPTVGVLASPDVVRIRITCKAASEAEALPQLDAVEAAVHQRMPGLILGRDEDTLESVINGLLKQRGWSLAVAEGSTGGVIAQRFFDAECECLRGSIVYVNNDIDINTVDIAREAMAYFGADSGLAVRRTADTKRQAVAFVSPTEVHEWEVAYPLGGARSRLRIAVLALEPLRKHLVQT